ncbi:MAG: TIGR00730 family Rossman fold protein [Xanthomonadaceae bacterium]|nr:TIGR00730 family Rossman fold protein [Xanthomonadaceae bacterium]MDP2187014.1 TIGR00730 family Rossman fold protein [Xanthomonadales bacterium]MDZ4117444.1 TIGR00730 family Rossman fold protein [Xanthomonadaceae bacterium]MDZ4379644.1 TIGR00730 family Rossman fold protein [Xanthomonadaceae bacterium]
MRVCVYAASSDHCSPEFHADAYALGRILAQQGASVVYGGGSRGSMGAVANGALQAGGEVIGILPRFMADLEWGHPGLTRMELVEDMRERKHRLLTGSDAVVALPGGCGTLEELFEAITLKRLGLYFNPIVLLNTRGYWQPLLDFMQAQVIGQQFMNTEHAAMWSLAQTPEQVPAVIAQAPVWGENAREFAAVRV